MRKRTQARSTQRKWCPEPYRGYRAQRRIKNRMQKASRKRNRRN